MGLTTNVPGLIWISEHKLLVFGISFVLLGGSIIMQYRARNLPCPIDRDEAWACTVARKWSMRITIFSVVVWLIGSGFALVPLLA